MTDIEILDVMQSIAEDVAEDLKKLFMESDGTRCPKCAAKEFLADNRTAILATLNQLGNDNSAPVMHSLSTLAWSSIAMSTVMMTLLQDAEMLFEDDQGSGAIID